MGATVLSMEKLAEDIGEAKPREVWSAAEWKQIERADRTLRSKGIAQLVRCANPDCPDQALTISTSATGRPVLSCGCRDRVLMDR